MYDDLPSPPVDTGPGPISGLFGPRPSPYSAEQAREAERKLSWFLEYVADDFFNLTEHADRFSRRFGSSGKEPEGGWARHHLGAGVFLMGTWHKHGYSVSAVGALAISIRLAHHYAEGLPPARRREKELLQLAAVALQTMALRRYEDLLVRSLKDCMGVEYRSHHFERPVPSWDPAEQVQELRKARAALSEAGLTLALAEPSRLVEAFHLLDPDRAMGAAK